jgi:hypothetical protein
MKSVAINNRDDRGKVAINQNFFLHQNSVGAIDSMVNRILCFATAIKKARDVPVVFL